MIFYDDGSVFICQRHSVVVLVIFRHIGRRDKYRGFAQQTKFRNGTCSCSRYYGVGYGVSIVHLRDEIGHENVIEIERIAVGYTWIQPLDIFFYIRKIIFSCLPDYLYVALSQLFYMSHNTIVDSTCSERASYYEQSLFRRVEMKISVCLVDFEISTQYVLAYGVTCKDYLRFVEKTLHPVVCHAYFFCSPSKEFICNPRKRVLLLQYHRYSQ